MSSSRHAENGRKSGNGRLLVMLAIPFVMVLVMLGSSPTSDGRGEDVGVAEARARWVDSGVEDYRIRYTYAGLGEATVDFVGGVVVEYRTDDPRLEDATIHWVDTLFDVLAAVEVDDGGDVTSVEYHPDLGYPVRASLDPDRAVVGDEWTFEVLALEAR